MKRIVLSAALAVALYAAPAQSIRDLDFMIGSWDITETIFPGTDREYQEKGVRTCSYYLGDQFIKCESETTISKSGRKRYYAYFFNYDEKENCYWATNLAHDFPLHGQQKWYLNKEQKLLQAISPKNVIGDRFFRATVSYAEPNQITWKGWRSKWDEDKAWQQVFHDVATKSQ